MPSVEAWTMRSGDTLVTSPMWQKSPRLSEKRAGYELAVDGIFGTMTRCSVKGFQSERGLAVDGIVGKQTWAALEGGGA